MPDIVTIGGSPSDSSRSSALLTHIRTQLNGLGWTTASISVRELNPQALVFGQADHLSIQNALKEILIAQAVVIATPVYKAAYSGVLKAFLDLLPPNILKSKVVLPVATGGSASHLLAIEYALKPVIAALGAQFILQGIYITDDQIRYQPDFTFEIDTDIEQRLDQSLNELASLLQQEHSYPIM